jgi:hypothetical protein
MKNVISNVFKGIFILSLSLMITSAFTQPVAPPKEPDPPGTLVHPPDEPYNGNGAPVDGGLAILLSLGGIYAARHIFKSRKEMTKG